LTFGRTEPTSTPPPSEARPRLRDSAVGELGSTTLEFTVHLRAHPAAGWLACRNISRHVICGLHGEDVEIRDSRGVLVAQSRQLATLAGVG